jgi:hypothetical protein
MAKDPEVEGGEASKDQGEYYEEEQHDADEGETAQ